MCFMWSRVGILNIIYTNFVFRTVTGVLKGQKRQTYVHICSASTICSLCTVNWKTHSFRCDISIRGKQNYKQQENVANITWKWGGG
jgi:hypothetical protein